MNDSACQRWERVTDAIDGLNRRCGRTLVSVGPWTRRPKGRRGLYYTVISFRK